MKRVLTGIKPTGLPHIGNYFGAIRPALDLSQKYDSFYFIADYHALTTIKDPKLMTEYTLNIAAAWLALGLDPDKTIFYKQSDITEIFELSWILSCFSAKGLLNRAHAYKSAVDENLKTHHDMDHNINHGIYAYPVLMAADILLFNTDLVPVGSDQKQHIEIARDIAEAINNVAGPVLKVPEPLIQDDTKLVPGIDGLKMSKNYNNTIPIFLPEKQLRKKVMQIVTDSTPVEAPKNAVECNVFKLFALFNNDDEQANLAKRYSAGGLGYGTVKQELFDTIMSFFKLARSDYDKIIEKPEYCSRLLAEGKQKAKEIASQTLIKVKYALGFTA
tara:strand:- start:727 stop:1719 length:993 start_codon:yes stop_codon:yes gene_type:complete